MVQVFDHLESEWNRLKSEITELYSYLGEQNLFEFEWNYKNILQENIYGVDKNLESVHITRLSLWLKTASKKETLTTLDDNIKVGNSLIDDPNIAGTYKDEKGQPKSLAFDWQQQFPKVFPSENAGFDIIVGNPPYGGDLNDKEQTFLKSTYDIGSTDTACLFIYKTSFLIKSDYHVGLIIPKSYCYASNYKKIRDFNGGKMTQLLDCKKVWKEVLLEQSIIILNSNNHSSYKSFTRENEKFIFNGDINQSDCKLFNFLLNSISKTRVSFSKKNT